MSVRSLSAIALGVSVVAMAGPADGQPPDRGASLTIAFRRFDANSDGKLSRAEYDRFVASAPRLKDNNDAADAIFRRLDGDSDGSLTAAEFTKLATFAGQGSNPPRPNPFAPRRPNPFADPKVEAKRPEPKPVDGDAPPTSEEAAFFEKKIRPVLVAKCQSCHSAADEKLKGGLALDSRLGVRTGGDSGTAVVPGNPSRSPLIKALRGDDYAQMPPKEKLDGSVIADFEQWIRMGAPDPRTGEVKKPEAIDIEKGKLHWSFQPVHTPAVPKVSDANWPTADLDRFVLAKLDEKKLTPAGEADRHMLIRRVTFDLIGLPPTPAEVEAFVNDPDANAFKKVVDRLLASPQFGERWGRHWLDVARYAESSGKEQNTVYPTAWRYRDWVIEAFNTDKPYDQFLKEQLAGDLLPASDDTDRAKKLIATGYLAIGPKSHNERNRTQFTLDLADEQIDAFTQGMLGLTVACARCHDHKFDPIPQADYYAIAGIFTSTDTKFGTPSLLIARNATPLQELPASADVPLGPTLSKFERTQLERRRDQLKEQRDKAVDQARKDRQPPVQLVFINAQLGVIEKQLSNYTDAGDARKLAMTVEDRRFPRDSPVYQRGEPNKPGATVPRGFLQVLPAGPPIRSGSGRKELAEWVASPENPLTARVMVNRIWLHLFGRGIVPTPDNFGTTGQLPSHPELLDHLAKQFVANGWSVKQLIREIVLSRTYRMSSEYDAADAAIDPDNVYLWRMSQRRLDAEALRDAMFAVAGQLDLDPMVGSPIAKFEGPVQGLQRFGGGLDRMAETTHRSVYLPVIRDNVPEVLALFDFAEPSLVTGARDDTSVPAQGLYLLNNPQVIKLSEKTAERLMKEYLSPSERIDAGFRLAFGRPATQAEEAAAEAFLEKFRTAESRAFRRKSDIEAGAWAAFAQALFAAAEFRYVD